MKELLSALPDNAKVSVHLCTHRKMTHMKMFTAVCGLLLYSGKPKSHLVKGH